MNGFRREIKFPKSETIENCPGYVRKGITCVKKGIENGARVCAASKSASVHENNRFIFEKPSETRNIISTLMEFTQESTFLHNIFLFDL